MKNFVKYLAVFLLGSLCVTPVKASEEKYTIIDYQNIVQKEADKYNIKISIIQYDASKEITAETIQRGMEELREYANSLKIVDVENQKKK